MIPPTAKPGTPRSEIIARLLASFVMVLAIFLLVTIEVWQARAQSGTLLVVDSFTGADHTPLMSHAPNVDVPGAQWVMSGSIDPGQWGLSTDIPAPGDYDGDGKVDPTIFRPSTGVWAILKSSTNYTTSTTVTWGASTDTPVPGDYDGDGKTDPAVYRPGLSGAGWYFLKSSTNYTSSGAVTLGINPDDVPVPGDYDGDHKTDPAVYSRSTGVWSFLKSSTNYTTVAQYSWGVATDKPVPGDYDGDGKVDPAIYRPSNGLWAILNSSTNYTTSSYATLGTSTDNPTPADYDGDGKTDPAIQRPSTGVWTVLDSSTGYSNKETFEMVAGATIPAQGDYNGDHKADAAFYRPSNGTWRYLASNAIVLNAAGEAGVTVTGSSWLSATIDARTPNGIISVDYRVPLVGPPFGGVVVRFTDPQNFLFVAHYNGALNLFRVVNGVFTTVNSSPVTAAPGSVHHIQAQLTGGLIEVSWDGVSRFTANEFFFLTATRHGIGWNPSYSPSGTYDNFQIIGFDAPGDVHVVITPAAVTMSNTGTQALTASVFDGNGSPVYGIPVTWTASDSAVAEVSATGVVTARGAAGVATITATPVMPNDVVKGTSGTATIRVKAPAWVAPDAFTFGNGTSGDALLYNPFSGDYSVQVNGAAGFTTLATGSWGAAGWIVRAGDLNGDGRTDLLRYNPTNGQVIRTINQGSGAFADYASTSPVTGAVPTLVDFNGDGRTDVFLYSPTTGAWAKGLSQGDSGFTYSTGAWGPHWQVYAAEWDGNSLGDLLLYDQGNGLSYKVTSLPDGTFGYFPVQWSAGWEVYPADFYRDGRTDVFLYNRTTGGWMQMLTVLSGWSVGSQGQWAPGSTIRVGDFNGDGRSDLFRYNADSGAWAVLNTKADLSFDTFAGSWSPGWGLSVTDFNGDGASDLLLYNSGTGLWQKAITTGPGAFSLTPGSWIPGWTVVSRTSSLPETTALAMTPSSVPPIIVGAGVSITARPLDSTGVTVGGVPLLWTTSNSAVLSVSASFGESVQVTGQSMGSATITVTTPNGLTAQRTVVVHCGGSVSPAVVNLPGDGVSGTTTLTSPGCQWLAASDSSWLSVSPSSGSGSGQVGYTVQPNDTAAERTGTVFFRGSDGSAFALFTVTQARRHCTGAASPPLVDVSFAGGSGSVTLTSQGGCPWTVVNDLPTWLQIAPTSGAGNALVGFTSQPNPAGTQRTATVTFKGPDGNAFATFTVRQGPRQCTGGVSPAIVDALPEGGSGPAALVVQGDCPWTVINDSPTWLQIVPTSGAGNASVLYTAQPNGTTGPRSATVTFKGPDSSAFAAFTVRQAPRLCTGGVSPPSVDVPFAGGSGPVALTVVGDCPWTVVNDSTSWLQIAPTSGAGNAAVFYTAQPNGTAAQRIGTVTFKGPDGTAFAAFTVSQHAAPQHCQGGTFPSGYPNFPDEGGPASVDLTVVGSCSWVAESDSTWLQVKESWDPLESTCRHASLSIL